ncbi:MAG: hypothetical protein RMZ43_036020, partial [Nostoc sp. CmiVER01]|uniref:hypothetical protein n=1 Tax=Nostoc sp. CmiVER01 TaxID=3075384 RepID=UPI003D161E41
PPLPLRMERHAMSLIPPLRPVRLGGLWYPVSKLGSLAPRLHAQEILYPGPAGKAHCAACAIDNSTQAVGGCTPTVLPALVNGQGRDVAGITVNGVLLGSCVNADSRERPVHWVSATSSPKH